MSQPIHPTHSLSHSLSLTLISLHLNFIQLFPSCFISIHNLSFLFYCCCRSCCCLSCDEQQTWLFPFSFSCLRPFLFLPSTLPSSFPFLFFVVVRTCSSFLFLLAIFYFAPFLLCYLQLLLFCFSAQTPVSPASFTLTLLNRSFFFEIASADYFALPTP